MTALNTLPSRPRASIFSATRAATLLALAIMLVAPAATADTYVEAPAQGTPEATVAKALAAGLAKSFDAYLKTIHPDDKENARQREQRKKYEWKRFQKMAANYCKTKSPVSFYVTRSEITGDRARLFVKDLTNPDRMPVPVRLKKTGSGWGIVANSL